MNDIQAKRVIYGTFGELWVDGEKLAEVEEVKATLMADKVEVKMAMHMTKGYKVVGYTGKGSVKLHKVSSYFIKKLAPSIVKGKQVECTLISKVSDPDAVGVERVALTGVIFDSVDLINWSVGKLGEESYDFTFQNYSLLDEANA